MSPSGLRTLRAAALVAGSGALLLAMTVYAEAGPARDLLWGFAVVSLAASLVANRLVRRAESPARPADGARQDGDPESPD